MTISLPKEKQQLLKKRAKNRGFGGVSEYLRFLIDIDDELIPKKELLSIVKEADRDFEKGLLIKRSSLRELL